MPTENLIAASPRDQFPEKEQKIAKRTQEVIENNRRSSTQSRTRTRTAFSIEPGSVDAHARRLRCPL